MNFSLFTSSARRVPRQTPPIKLPLPPPAPVVPEPISELRQEIADMHVQQPPTWQRQVAAFGHQAEDLAKHHPGAAVLASYGLGLAVGTVSILLMRRRDTPQHRATSSLHDLRAALRDLLVPAANRAVQRGVDATSHGLHTASEKFDASAQSGLLHRLRNVFA